MEKQFFCANKGTPAFAVVWGVKFNTLDGLDTLGTYDPLTMTCTGSMPFTKSKAVFRAFGDDESTAVDEGFSPGEEIKLFYHDSQTGKTYDILFGDSVNYAEFMAAQRSHKKEFNKSMTVDEKNTWIDANKITFEFNPMALMFIRDISLGDEICLRIVPELTTEKIIIPVNDVYTPGAKIDVTPLTEHITNLDVFVENGNGTVYPEHNTFGDIKYYFAGGVPGMAQIVATGNSVFDGATIEDSEIIAINTENKDPGEVYKDDFIKFYWKDGHLWADTLQQDLYITLEYTKTFGKSNFAAPVYGTRDLTAAMRYFTPEYLKSWQSVFTVNLMGCKRGAPNYMTVFKTVVFNF